MMKDIFLHRLKIKDAFLRNAGLVRNIIFYRAIFPTGILLQFCTELRIFYLLAVRGGQCGVDKDIKK